MKWIADAYPPETGAYIVSIMFQRAYGTKAFKYIAYFDKTKSQWFKYDPFADKYTPTDPVEGVVTAWVEDDMGVFLK